MLKILSIIYFLISSQQLYSQGRGDTIKIDLKKAKENYVYSSNEVDAPALTFLMEKPHGEDIF
nr:hypothetical protein [Pedobacter kyonggii]